MFNGINDGIINTVNIIDTRGIIIVQISTINVLEDTINIITRFSRVTVIIINNNGNIASLQINRMIVEDPVEGIP